MKKYVAIVICGVALTGCGKVGVSGSLNQFVGDWAEVRMPSGCVAKQIAGEEGTGVIVLCQDGRVFH